MVVSRHYIVTSMEVQLKPIFDEEITRWINGQIELAPTTNKEHYQIYVEFIKPMSHKKAAKVIGYPGAHMEVRRGTRQEARNYCSKDDTYLRSRFEYGTWIKGQGHRGDIEDLVEMIKEGKSDYEILKTDANLINKYQKFIGRTREILQEQESKEYLTKWAEGWEPRDYQQEWMMRMRGQNDRQITVIVDETGGAGKTQFTKWMVATQGATRFTNAKTKDIAYAYNYEKYICIDLSRTQQDRINWGVIEDLKNGCLFSTKYESRTKWFEPPKIILMMNQMPNRYSLSEDRWDIIEI